MATKKKSKISFFKKTLKNHNAFSLMEIMIVLGIVAFVLTIAIPKLSGPGTQIKGDIRRFAVMSRKLFQIAQIRKKTYRIAIDMRGVDADGNKTNHSYWIEYADGAKMMENYAPGEAPEDEDGNLITAFQKDTKILKSDKRLPEGFVFSKVSYGGREDIDSGLAYIYYFPQGYTEESLIQIANLEAKLFWSLLVNPLTGQTDIITKQVSLKDLKQGK